MAKWICPVYGYVHDSVHEMAKDEATLVLRGRGNKVDFFYLCR